MANKYRVDIIEEEDNLVAVKLFKNESDCNFKDILNEKVPSLIILDLIVQAYVKGKGT